MNRVERPWMMEGMHDRPAVQALRRAAATGRRLAGRWAQAPRTVDLLTALSALALMSLDVPGLSAADNPLNGPLAALVLTAGARLADAAPRGALADVRRRAALSAGSSS